MVNSAPSPMNFKLIDPLIGLFSGGFIAFSVCRLVPETWNMIAGMLAGGVGGMVLHVVLLLLLAPFFGAFEVMVPLGIIGMGVGMAAGMAGTQPQIPTTCITASGAVAGLVIAIVIFLSNKKLTQAN